MRLAVRTFRPPSRVLLCLLLALAGGLGHASAQATTTASRVLDPAFFAGATLVSTGLDAGRNVSVTAGLDLGLPTIHGIEPALEYRGMEAIAAGKSDQIKNNVAGLKFSMEFRRLNPYADLLAGRSETTYANGGYQVANSPVFYVVSSSNVYSFGGGVDVFTTTHLALKIDFQAQRSSSPVAPSGHVFSETVTVGVVYALRLGHRGRE